MSISGARKDRIQRWTIVAVKDKVIILFFLVCRYPLVSLFHCRYLQCVQCLKYQVLVVSFVKSFLRWDNERPFGERCSLMESCDGGEQTDKQTNNKLAAINCGKHRKFNSCWSIIRCDENRKKQFWKKGLSDLAVFYFLVQPCKTLSSSSVTNICFPFRKTPFSKRVRQYP